MKGAVTHVHHFPPPTSSRTHFQHFPSVHLNSTSHTSQLTPLLHQLYESNARPHLYWFVAKFFKRKGDSQPNYYRPSDTPGLFWREFSLFEHFFEKKTGIPWEKRLILCNPSTRIADATPASGVDKEEGGLADEKAWVDGDPKKEIWYKLEDEGRRFVYEPPVSPRCVAEGVDANWFDGKTGGKPVGWAPPEFIPVVVEEDVPVAGEEVKAQAQTLDTTVGVAAQDGRGGEADIAMLDAEEEETEETDSTEMHTPDEEIEDEGVEEEQEEDTDMASDTSEDDSEDESVGAAQEDAVMTMETNTRDLHAGVDEAQEATATLIDAKVQHPDVEEMEASSMQMDTNTRDTSIAGVQGDVVMAMEINPKVSDTSIDQVQEATAMSTDTKTQHPDPEEIHEATAMPVDTTTGDTSIDGVQGDAAMTAKTIANATSVEAQETIAEVPDMEIISDVEGMQEATAMTMMESSTQRPTIEDAQDVTAIMNTDAVTEDTYVNLAQRAIAMLANIKTKDTGVDRAQQGAAMAADSEIKAISVDDVQEVNAMTMDADANSKDIKVEETQEDTPSTSGTNADSCPAEANTSSALDRDV